LHLLWRRRTSLDGAASPFLQDAVGRPSIAPPPPIYLAADDRSTASLLHKASLPASSASVSVLPAVGCHFSLPWPSPILCPFCCSHSAPLPSSVGYLPLCSWSSCPAQLRTALELHT
ncbi:Os06g0640201, partial [Oryza sativa Japonica Group]